MRSQPHEPAAAGGGHDEPPVVEIVPLARKYLRRVLEIERVVYPTPWSMGLYLSEMAMRRTRSYRVSLVGGLVAGYGGVMMNGDEAHVTTLAVDPSWQGRGLATRLLLQLTHDSLRRGGRRMTLEVRESNVRARVLYEWFGFEVAGLRRNYYRDPGGREHAVVMTAPSIADAHHRRRLQAIAGGLEGRTVPPEDEELW